MQTTFSNVSSRASIRWTLLLALLLSVVASPLFFVSTASAEGDLLNNLEGAKHIPGDAHFIVAIDSIQGTYDRVGVSKVIEQNRIYYEMMVAEIYRHMKFNFTDPKVLAGFGVDLNQPLGFFWQSLKEESFGFFFHTSNAAILERTFKEILDPGGRKIRDLSKGKNRILCIDGDVCLLIKGKLVFLTGDGRGSKPYAEELAQKISTLALKDSIYKTPAFQEAAARREGAELAGVAQVGPLYRLNADRSHSYEKEETERIKAEIKAATDPDSRARAEENLRRHTKWIHREEAESKLLDIFFGEIPSFSFGCDAASDAIKCAAFATQSSSADLSSALQNLSATHKLQEIVTETPVFMLDGGINSKKAVEIFDLFLVSEGEAPEEFREKFHKELGIDIDRDIFSKIDGEVGFAVTANMLKALIAGSGGSDEDAFKHIGGTAIAHVSDPVGIQKVLDKLGSHRYAGPFLSKTPSNNGYLLKTPWRNIHIALVDSYLVLSTDAKVLTRLGNTSVAFPANPPLKSLLSEKGNAVTILIDQHLIFAGFGALSAGDYNSEMYVDSGKKDSAWIAKKAKYDALKKEVRVLSDARNTRNLTAILKAMDPIGVQAIQFKITPSGLAMTGGLYYQGASFPDALSTVVSKSIDAWKVSEAPDGDLDRKREEMWKLESELSGMSPSSIHSATKSTTKPSVIVP